MCNDGDVQCGDHRVELCANGQWVTKDSCLYGCDASSLTCFDCDDTETKCIDGVSYGCENKRLKLLKECGTMGCLDEHECKECEENEVNCTFENDIAKQYRCNGNVWDDGTECKSNYCDINQLICGESPRIENAKMCTDNNEIVLNEYYEVKPGYTGMRMTNKMCADEEKCIDGVCTCEIGKIKCIDKQLQVCSYNSDSLEWTDSAPVCSENKLNRITCSESRQQYEFCPLGCTNGKCNECINGTTKCSNDGRSVIKCNNGIWSKNENKCNDNEGCEYGECINVCGIVASKGQLSQKNKLHYLLLKKGSVLFDLNDDGKEYVCNNNGLFESRNNKINENFKCKYSDNLSFEIKLFGDNVKLFGDNNKKNIGFLTDLSMCPDNTNSTAKQQPIRLEDVYWYGVILHNDNPNQISLRSYDLNTCVYPDYLCQNNVLWSCKSDIQNEEKVRDVHYTWNNAQICAVGTQCSEADKGCIRFDPDYQNNECDDSSKECINKTNLKSCFDNNQILIECANECDNENTECVAD